MAFSLNFAALEASLLADALPKRARTDGAPSKIGPQRKPRSSDAESDASPILRAYAMTYPRSLVSANRGVATSGVPASAAAGVRARAHAAALRAESMRCPVRATPQRVSACARANVEADGVAALPRDCGDAQRERRRRAEGRRRVVARRRGGVRGGRLGKGGVRLF